MRLALRKYHELGNIENPAVAMELMFENHLQSTHDRVEPQTWRQKEYFNMHVDNYI